MDIKTYRVKSYNSKKTTVVCVDGIPVVAVRGKKELSKVISYLSGYDIDISEGSVKRELDKCLGKVKDK